MRYYMIVHCQSDRQQRERPFWYLVSTHCMATRIHREVDTVLHLCKDDPAQAQHHGHGQTTKRIISSIHTLW